LDNILYQNTGLISRIASDVINYFLNNPLFHTEQLLDRLIKSVNQQHGGACFMPPSDVTLVPTNRSFSASLKNLKNIFDRSRYSELGYPDGLRITINAISTDSTPSGHSHHQYTPQGPADDRPDKDEEYAIQVASNDDKILTEYTPLNSKNEVGRGGSNRGGNRLHKNKTKKHKKHKTKKNKQKQVAAYYDKTRKFGQCLQANKEYVNKCLKKATFIAKNYYKSPKISVNKTCKELGYHFIMHDPIFNMGLYWNKNVKDGLKWFSDYNISHPNWMNKMKKSRDKTPGCHTNYDLPPKDFNGKYVNCGYANPEKKYKLKKQTKKNKTKK
jgi:hypothetical protein